MVHAIVKCGTYFIVGLLLALLWSEVASAQTSTPTPTATPAPTATPVPTAVYYGQYSSSYPGGYNPDALYGCRASGLNYDSYTTPNYTDGTFVCFQLDTQTVNGQLLSEGIGTGGYLAVNAENVGVKRSDAILYIMPPLATMTMTGGCDYFIEFEGTGISASHANPSGTRFTHTTPWNNASASTSFLWTTVRNGSYMSNNSWWAEVPVLHAFNESLPSSTGINASGEWRLSVFTNLANRGASQSLTCYVTGLYFADGSDVIELDPPTPTPLPTSSLPGGGAWATPVPWAPGDPTLIMTGTLDIQPIGTTCHEMLPSFSADGVTVFGYTVGAFAVPEFEVCLEEYSMGLNFLGWDFGVLVVAIAALGMGGAFYGLMRMG